MRSKDTCGGIFGERNSWDMSRKDLQQGMVYFENLFVDLEGGIKVICYWVRRGNIYCILKFIDWFLIEAGRVGSGKSR